MAREIVRMTFDPRQMLILLEAMQKFPDTVYRKHLRRGTTKAARVMAKAVKDEAPKESGSLKASIGYRIYTTKDKVVGAVIGPRTDTKKSVATMGPKYRVGVRSTRSGRVRRTTKKERKAGVIPAAYYNPVRYAHLIEFGTQSRTVKRAKVLYSPITGKFFGRTTAAMPRNPFMTRAYGRTKDQAVAIIGDEVRQAIDNAGKP